MYKVTLINGGIETVIHHSVFNDLKVAAGQIKEGINVADGFSFTILPNNPGYDLIFPLKTLITVENLKTGKVDFDGRILSPTESMSESGSFAKAYVCEGELGYLNDSCQRHGEYHDITVRDFLQVMIENHNADIADDDIDKRFEVGIVDVDSSTGTLYRYLGYENTWDAIEDKLIDRLGGEIRVRKENGIRYLDYLQKVGTIKQTEIRLAKNLKSITKEVDPSDIITRLIPLGERIESENEGATDASQARLTIESVNGGLDYIVDTEAEQALGTVVIKSQTWDDITQPNILKTRGEQFLQENNRVKSKHSVSALDLFLIDLDTDSFDVGNYYPVINPVMGIIETLRVVGKTTDILDPKESDLTIGDKFKTASQYQQESQKSEKEVVNLKNMVERQSRTISTLKTELTAADDAVVSIESALSEADLPALEQAVLDLNEAIDNLNQAIDNVPVYDPATPIADGLMSAVDKSKLDLITVLNGIDLDALKAKLDLITIVNPVDIDNLVDRVEALENAP